MSAATPAQGVVIPLGGFPVLSTTQEAFALDLFHALAAHQPRRVFFANTNFIVQCQALRARMQAPAVRIVNDGRLEPAGHQKFVEDEMLRWSKVIKDSGETAE